MTQCILMSQGNVMPPLEGALPGTWIWKSTTLGDVFPGFGENIVPICKNFSGNTSHNWWENSQIGFSGSTSASCNSQTVASASANKSGGVGSQVWGISVSANSVFLPFFYGFDLSKIQQTETSGTITVWLEKIA